MNRNILPRSKDARRKTTGLQFWGLVFCRRDVSGQKRADGDREVLAEALERMWGMNPAASVVVVADQVQANALQLVERNPTPRCPWPDRPLAPTPKTCGTLLHPTKLKPGLELALKLKAV